MHIQRPRVCRGLKERYHLGGRLKYFFAVILVFTTPFAHVLGTSAAPPENIYEISQSNSVFYDRDPCLDVSFTADSNGGDVYIIGDSITVQSQQAIKNLLPSATIDAQSSIWFSQSQPNLTSGVDRLNKLGNQKILVFALGTNGGITQADLDALFTAIAGKDLKLILMTLYYKDGSSEQMTSSNSLLKKIDEQYQNVSLMDWYSIAASDPEHLLQDNVHPTTPEGTQKFAKTLKAAVDEISTVNIEANVGSGDFNIIKTAKNAEKSFFNGEPLELSAQWNDTDKASMKKLLENYGDLAYQLGKAVGAPYIAILVQMRYEDPLSKCGRNNFWGNGCPPGTKNGNAKKQGANLGEGFVQYAETLTNGMHDQALGITDPKEYLQKIGPTWVQGDVNGAGYSEISSMLKSAEALQNYINSSEGQSIVKNFGNYTGTLTGAQCCLASASSHSAQSNISWQDGWIVSGITGFEKQTATGDQNWGAEYATTSINGTTPGPNKILLHAFEGYDPGDGSMIKAVYQETERPPHFTIDLKHKKLYQHTSINQAASAIKDPEGDAAKYGDRSAGIQIEIMGYDNTAEMPSDYQEWYLPSNQNFSASDWGYLANLLSAISSETGIPLTSDVDWSKSDNSVRLSNQAFADYQGILSHKHAPLPNDHTDLQDGAIWDQVQTAINSVTNPSGQICGLSSTGDVRSLQETILKFAWPDYKGVGFTKMMPDYQDAVKRAIANNGYVGAGGIDCGGFVTVLMRESGWDPEYNSSNGSTGLQLTYLKDSPLWQDVTEQISSNADAQPGDVLIYDGHTLVFAGDIPGFNSKMASASLGQRSPMADSVEDISYYRFRSGHPYRIFRKVK